MLTKQKPIHVELLRGECPGGGYKKPYEPTLAYLELTPACNCRCPGCLNSSFMADFDSRQLKPTFRRPPLSLKQWTAILTQLPASVTSIILSGGEPTLYPDFLNIVEIIEERGLDFVIFSNGLWTERSTLIASLQATNHFQGFLISLHGASAESHDPFMGVTGAFERAVTNIKQAVQANLPVTLSTVITKHNLQELGAVAELAIAIGAEELSFNRYLLSAKRSLSHDVPSTTELQDAMYRIEQLQVTYGNQLRIGYGPCIPQCFASSSSTGCGAGASSFVVDPWGNVKPCLKSDLLAGDLSEETFERVWNHPELARWRKLFNDSCSACSAFTQCGGGCRAIAWSAGMTEDPLMVAPLSAVS